MRVELDFIPNGASTFLAWLVRNLEQRLALHADPALRLHLTLDPDAPVALHVVSTARMVRIVGRTFSDLSGGAFWFLERLGFLFEFSREYPPERPIETFPVLDRSFALPIRQRGIRMHLNFVQDQSCFTEEEFGEFVDRLPTLRMNYLLFHMYANQEWYPFTYRGVEQLDLSVGNLERKPLRAGMIGRERILVKAHWFPREYESITDPVELRDAMYGRYKRMMSRARRQGTSIAVSFEPESVGGSFADRLAAWGAEGPAIAASTAASTLADDWQADWSGRPLADADVRHPLMRDLAAARATAILESFPDLDELHLISREGASYRLPDEASYLGELKRLIDRFSIRAEELDLDAVRQPVVISDRTIAGNPRSYPYWTVPEGENHFATVTAVLRFVEFARDILASEPLASRLAARGIRPVVTVYAPNPVTVRLTTPIIARMLPEGQAFHLLSDYGARDIARGMDDWKPLLPKHDVGLVSWLEFDGCMMLAQGWSESIADNVRKAHALGINSQMFNHWRVRTNEHNARAAAEAMWDPAADAAGQSEDYWRALYGAGGVGAARGAYGALERATVYAKERNFNVGFTTDWVVRICTEPPGYYWRYLLASSEKYAAAARAFDALTQTSSGRGREQARYMADMCRISSDHLRAVHHLQMAKLPLVGFKLWPVPAEDPACLPPPEFLAPLLAEARAGLELEYGYMRTLAKWTRTCDEQGQLAMHQQGLIEPFEELVAALDRWVAQETGRAQEAGRAQG
jgi:hypothetical protein